MATASKLIDYSHSQDEFVMVNHADISSSYLASISEHIDALSEELRHISLEIHDNPELQYKEFHAHKVLTEYFSQVQDGAWKVTPSAYGIETAFVAVYSTKRSGPVVSFNAEYDALKGNGHACGHNLIAIVSVAAALATAQILKDNQLGGSVVILGTPAEEGGGGKIKLLDAGAYRDNNVDISLISHPGITRDTALTRTAAYASLKVEYFGKEAHAAARPWDGINALDALVTAYNSVSVLRQQTEPGDIIQCNITNGGLRPNIIHAYSSAMFVVRSSTRARLEALKKRVFNCFEAGATATGAKLQVSPKGTYDDHMPNRTLGARFRDAFNRLGGDIPAEDVDYITGSTTASTDQGNISYAMPSISPNFWIRSESKDGTQLGGPHTPDFERAARTAEAHGLALRVAKGLAATAVDMLTQPELLQQVKREFEESSKRSA